MNIHFKESFSIVFQLLLRDIKIALRFLFDDIVDSMILVGFIYLMYTKLLPLMGVGTSMITPAFVGILVIAMINVAYDRAIKDALDFENTRFVDYQITLPISIRWLMTKYSASYAIDIFFASFPVFFLGRLLFGSLLDTSHANFFLFFLVYCLSIVLIGQIFLLIVVARSFNWIVENSWPRIFLPMILLGALYYPWSPVASFLPILSKLMLLLPTVYIAEGLRSALTGSEMYISAGHCLIALIIFIAGVTFLIFRAMHKRIDPV